MAKIHLIGVAAVAAAVAAGCCDKKECDAKVSPEASEPAKASVAEPEKDPNEVVMAIAGEKLLRSALDADIELVLRTQGANIPPERLGAARRSIADQLVRQFLVNGALAAKAKALGYELTDEDMKKRDEEYRKSVANNPGAPQTLEALAETLPLGKERALAEMRKNALIEKMIQKEVYGKDTTDYTDRAKEIIKKIEERNAKALTDEEAAKKVAELKKQLDDTPAEELAAKFGELAKAESACPSAASGGDLGKFKRGAMVAEFDKAAFEIEPNKVSDPVKTRFGYHLILVKERNGDECRASHILLGTGEKEMVPDTELVVNELRREGCRSKLSMFIVEAINEAKPVAADEFKSMLPPPVPAAAPAPRKPAVVESEPVEIPAEKPAEEPAKAPSSGISTAPVEIPAGK